MKDALFSAAEPALGVRPRSRPRTAGAGRHALFSAPPRRRGTVVVECSGCEARTPVRLVEVPLRLLPSLWWPVRSFSRFMRCPSCDRFAWCRVDWRAALTV